MENKSANKGKNSQTQSIQTDLKAKEQDQTTTSLIKASVYEP